MEWETYSANEFAQHAAHWDAFQGAVAPVPFLESQFLQPLLDEFGTGHEILVIGKDNGRWCAAAIFAPPRLGIWRLFQPPQLPLGPWISAPSLKLSELFDSLIRAVPGYAIALSVRRIDPLFLRRPADRSQLKTFDYVETAWVEVNQPFAVYWKGRGKNLRSNVRKQRAKLESEGVIIAMDCIDDPRRLPEALAEYGQLECAGWKGREGTAVHPSNKQGRFYLRMLENFCSAGRGRVFRYRFNDKTVAMDLCIEAGDRIVILKISYDENHKDVSPSTLLRYEEFQLLFSDKKAKRIEFYGALMEWHTRWTTSRRTLYNITIYRWAWLATLRNTLIRRRFGRVEMQCRT